MKQTTATLGNTKQARLQDADSDAFVQSDARGQYALLETPPLSSLRNPPATMYRIHALLKKQKSLVSKQGTDTLRRHSIFSKNRVSYNQPFVNSFLSTISVWDTGSGSEAHHVRQRHTCTAFEQSLIIYGGCTNLGTAPEYPIIIYQTVSKIWTMPEPLLDDSLRQGDAPSTTSSPALTYSAVSATSTGNDSQVPSGVKSQPGSEPESNSRASTSPDVAVLSDEKDHDDVSKDVVACKPNLRIENRYSHTAVLLKQWIYIFGGICTQTSELANTILVYDIVRNVWNTLDMDPSHPKPAPRQNHLAVVARNAMYIWGGRGADSILNDMWKYDFELNQWFPITMSGTIPSPRYSHAATVCNSSIWVHGGHDGSKEVSDFFCFNTRTSTWRTVTPQADSILPPEKHSHTLSTFEEKIILTGGSSLLDGTILDVYIYFTERNRWMRVEYAWSSDQSEVASLRVKAANARSKQTYGSSLRQSRVQRSVSQCPEKTVAKQNRLFHSSVILPSRSCSLYIFGGASSQTSRNLDCLHIEFEQEFDLLSDKKLSSLPKREWEAAAMFYHPDILALSEKLRPLTNSASYSGTLRRTGKTQALETFDNKQVLMLISEWLAFNGCRQTLVRLMQATSIKYVKPSGTGSSILDCLLSIAKRRIDDDVGIWGQEVLSYLVDNSIVENFDHFYEGHVHLENSVNRDINIWEEPINCDNLKVEKDGEIKYASLNVLVQLLLGYRDTANGIRVTEKSRCDFLDQFFYTYHVFITPERLLEKIIQLYTVPSTTISIQGKGLIHLHRQLVLHLLEYWIYNAPWDWEAKRLCVRLKAFLESCRTPSKLNVSLAQKIQALLKSAAALNNNNNNSPRQSPPDASAFRDRTALATDVPNPPDVCWAVYEQPIVPANIFSPKLTLDDVVEIEIARQVTLIQFSYFYSIKPKELLNRWLYRQEPDYHAHNLRVFLSYASKITDWTLSQVSSAQMIGRRHEFKQFNRLLKIATHLKAFKNYQGLVAILNGLSKLEVTRTQKATKKVFNSLIATVPESLGCHSSSFPAKPCIPLLEHVRCELQEVLQLGQPGGGIFVDDNGQKLIDVSKCGRIKMHIDSFSELQSRQYEFIPVYQIARLLNNLGQH